MQKVNATKDVENVLKYQKEIERLSEELSVALIKYEDKEEQYEEILEEHKALVRWKSNFTRIGLAVITSLGAILTWLLSEFINR